MFYDMLFFPSQGQLSSEQQKSVELSVSLGEAAGIAGLVTAQNILKPGVRMALGASYLHGSAFHVFFFNVSFGKTKTKTLVIASTTLPKVC